MRTIVYIRMRKRSRVPVGRAVTVGDVARLLAPPGEARGLAALVLCRPGPADGHLVLIDILSVVACVREALPEAGIEIFGEPQCVVELVSERKGANWIGFALVWLLLFFGSGLAIMNFHEDVSMPRVHQRLVYLLTGETVEHPYALQIPYSFGIGLGMVIFFNHIFKKKINEEPSPLDVEMHKYEESVLQYVITEEYRKLDELPSGGASDASGAVVPKTGRDPPRRGGGRR